jgi:hypothetical protein
VIVPFRIEFGVETYRILGPGGEEGCRVEYGEVATCKIGESVYIACADDPNDEDALAKIEVQYVSQTMAEETDTEFIAFDDEPDEDGDEEGEEEEEDEEEEESVT